MPTGLNKTFRPTMRMWKKIGSTMVTWIKRRTDRGIDREGRRFPAYTEGYAEFKASGGYPTLSGVRLSKTKPGRLKGISTSRQVSPPNFRLRGWTMSDLQIRNVTRKELVIGWRGEFAGIVHAHEERKKYKVGGITEKEFDRILEMVDAEFVKQWNRNVKDQTITISV